MVTIMDVANAVGVSKATISRALNNKSRISSETREKIKKTAEEMGYTPNMRAVGLAKNVTNIIAVELPRTDYQLADPFFVEFLGAVSDVVRKSGYSLMLPDKPYHTDYESLEKWASELKNIDGIILTDPILGDPRISYLEKYGKPYIFLGRPFEDDNTSTWVDCDNEQGAYEATSYLIKKGYCDIVFVSGKDELVSTHKRFSGYKRAMTDSGFTGKISVIRGDNTQMGGYGAVKLALENGLKITAMFAGNDLMALGAMKAMKEKGIRVPEDCKLVGFDGIKLSEMVIPSLTTIEQPIYKLGEVAAEMLLKQINGIKLKEKQVVLPVRLVERETS